MRWRRGSGTRCDVRRRGGATAVGRGGTSDDAERRNLSRALLFQLEVYSSTLSDSFRGNVVFKPSTSVVAAVECGVADLDDRLRKAERAQNEPSRGGALGEGTSMRKVTSGAEVEGRRFLGPGFYYVLDPVSFQMSGGPRMHSPADTPFSLCRSRHSIALCSHSATEKSRATFSKIENILLPDASNTSLRRDDSKSGLAFFTFLQGGGSTEK